MIKTIISAALILILQAATPYWWWAMVIPLLVAFVSPMPACHALVMGAVSAGAVWILAALALFLTQSEIIAARVALMLNLGSGWVLVPLTCAIAAIAGGVAGATGAAMRSCLRKGNQ